MSVRVDSGLLIPGKFVVGHPGHGFPASQVPSTGEDGPGYMHEQIVALGLTTEAVRGEITAFPNAGVFTANEVGGFEHSGTLINDSFTYQLYVDGVATGAPQVVTLEWGTPSLDAVLGALALNITEDSIDPRVTVNESTAGFTIYWAVYPSNNADPTPAEVVAGTGFAGASNDPAPTSIGVFTGATITGLAPGSYKLAAVRSDGVTHSNATISSAFTILEPVDLSYPATLLNLARDDVYFDLLDWSTMFQDRAGTIPVTAIGQPCGCVISKSTNRIRATAPTDSARPQVTGEGLLFDGVDDHLRTRVLDFSMAWNATLGIAGHSPTTTGTGVPAAETFAAFWNAPDAHLWWFISAKSDETEPAFCSAGSGVVLTYNRPSAPGITREIPVALTGRCSIDNDQSKANTNGVKSTINQNMGGGPLGEDRLYIGYREAYGFLSGTIGAVLLASRFISDAEDDVLNAFLQVRAGVAPPPPPNQAPVTQNLSSRVTPDTVDASLRTLKGTDVDGTIGTFRLASLPAGGTLKVSGANATLDQVVAQANAGNLTYTPPAAFEGIQTFTFAARDNEGLEGNVATYTIHVKPPGANKLRAAKRQYWGSGRFPRGRYQTPI